MRVLNVELGDRSYPIYIGRGLLHEHKLIKPYIRGPRALVVTNDTLEPLYLSGILEALGLDTSDAVVLPDGEPHKTLDTLNLVFDTLLERRHDRSTTLIALGGGVVGDMTGFAAACYQRGVNFIQMPTTLLAQVDSSVGGKTAVNHPLGKNMIGAFHQPECVIIDLDVLHTLPEREFKAGLAEVVKYGLIADYEFFVWLEEHMPALLARDQGSLLHAIERSCALKALIVAEDEKESGRRAILNLGHTFGHAIETSQAYGQWLHGEAVAAGMIMASKMSCRLGFINHSDVERVEVLLRGIGLPTEPPPIDTQEFLRLMAVDKKALAGKIRLVLLEALGQAYVSADYDEGQLRATLDSCKSN